MLRLLFALSALALCAAQSSTTDVKTIAWIGFSICPNVPGQTYGDFYSANVTGNATCPTVPTPSPQSFNISADMFPNGYNGKTFIVALFRTSNIWNGQISFTLQDATGKHIVGNPYSATLENFSSTSGASRRLLKGGGGRGGGGGRSSGGRSSGGWGSSSSRSRSSWSSSRSSVRTAPTRYYKGPTLAKSYSTSSYGKNRAYGFSSTKLKVSYYGGVYRTPIYGYSGYSRYRSGFYVFVIYNGGRSRSSCYHGNEFSCQGRYRDNGDFSACQTTGCEYNLPDNMIQDDFMTTGFSVCGTSCQTTDFKLPLKLTLKTFSVYVGQFASSTAVDPEAYLTLVDVDSGAYVDGGASSMTVSMVFVALCALVVSSFH